MVVFQSSKQLATLNKRYSC